MVQVERQTLRSYVILTEEGRLISRNRVHICHTNVHFQLTRPYVPKMPVLPPTTSKPVLPTNPSKDSQMPKSNTPDPPALPHKQVENAKGSELRTRSRRLIKKPARYQ